MSIRFSIVTVSFNQAQYLGQCVDSVLAQDCPVEYIVMDGGSTDGSVDILAARAAPGYFWTSQPDRGPAHALNLGFAQATGDYIGYINSDDFLLPGALGKLARIIEEHPGYDVYYGPGMLLNEIEGTCNRVLPSRWNLGVYRAELSVMMQQSIFFRLAKLREWGIEFNEANTTHWDGEHLVDIDLVGGRFFRHWKTLSTFRIHQGSLTGGAQGEAWRIKYRAQVDGVARRIDQQRPNMIRHRLYWIAWLFFCDPVVTLYRALRKLRKVVSAIFERSKTIVGRHGGDLGR